MTEGNENPEDGKEETEEEPNVDPTLAATVGEERLWSVPWSLYGGVYVTARNADEAAAKVEDLPNALVTLAEGCHVDVEDVGPARMTGAVSDEPKIHARAKLDRAAEGLLAAVNDVLEWEATTGGWDAPCWARLRAARDEAIRP